MGSISARGGKRAKCVLGNYEDKYLRADGARGVAPLHGSMEGSGALADPSPYQSCFARGPFGGAGDNTSMAGDVCLDPTAKRPRSQDTEDDWRTFGILHGRKITTGLDERPEVADCGFLPGFARGLRTICADREEAISTQFPQWGDGARKVALGVYLMSHVRQVNIVDMVHFLHLAVGGSLLFVRDRSVSYYKRGAFRKIGAYAPAEVFLQCAQYAHTLRGALLCMDENGAVRSRGYI